MIITLKEWAERRGVKLNTARRRVLAGSLPGAVKRGRDWWIDEDAEFFDRRLVENKDLLEWIEEDNE